MFAIATNTTSSSIMGEQDSGSRFQERWAKMVLHGIWIVLIVVVCIMLGLALSGSLSMSTFFIVLACASAVMFAVMIVVDLSSRFPNPIGMPWIRMVQNLLRKVARRD